jgi:hypothetical protein
MEMIPKAQAMKEKLDKVDFIKIKTLCSLKDIINRLKSSLQSKRKHLKIICDTGLIYRIYKQFDNYKKKQIIQLKNK